MAIETLSHIDPERNEAIKAADLEVASVLKLAKKENGDRAKRNLVSGYTIDSDGAYFFEDGIDVKLDEDRGTVALHVLDASLFSPTGAIEHYLRDYSDSDKSPISTLPRLKDLAFTQGQKVPSITFLFDFEYDQNPGDGSIAVKKGTYCFSGAQRTLFQAQHNFHFGNVEGAVRKRMGYAGNGIEKIDVFKSVSTYLLKNRRRPRSQPKPVSPLNKATEEFSFRLGTSVAMQLIYTDILAPYIERADPIKDFDVNKKIYRRIRPKLKGNYAPVTSPLSRHSDFVFLNLFVATQMDKMPSPYFFEDSGEIYTR